MSSIYEIKKKYHDKLALLDIELLISHVIKKPREFVLAYPEHKINKSQIENLKSKIKRRMRHEPLAYISGHKEFYGLDFRVNKNTLVPRPETELMVDEALRIAHGEKYTTLIDVGTGSGCIAIALAKNLINSEFIAIDISKSALNVAKQNAKTHKVDKKIKFLRGNLLEPIIKKTRIINPKSKIIITANLPYLTPEQVKNSPSIKKEPKLALVAGRDGLKYYRELFKQIKLFNIQCQVLCEIDPAQTLKIKEIIKNIFPKNNIKIKKDLRGLERIVIAKIN